jgi:predicted Zn-dependent peptidase
MEQLAEKRMYAEGDCQPQIEVRYHAVPFDHADSFALDMLAEILNGRTGRLYKKLVEGAEIASRARAGLDARKYGGAFSFSAECKGDATPEQLEQGWYGVLAEIQEEPVGERELQKVKNQVLADSYRRLQSNFFLMIQLGLYEALGGWEYINESPAKLQAVTAEDLQRVARKYFEPTNRSVAVYTRKAGAAPEDPELAALPPEARAMVQQAAAQFAAMEDLAQLETIRAQLAGSLDQAPADRRPVLELLLTRIDDRIAELSAAADQ